MHPPNLDLFVISLADDRRTNEPRDWSVCKRRCEDLVTAEGRSEDPFQKGSAELAAMPDEKGLIVCNWEQANARLWTWHAGMRMLYETEPVAAHQRKIAG